MIYLKLRHRGERVNHKRVSGSMRGKVAGATAQAQEGACHRPPAADEPSAPNEVWSMDFVFDRSADGRVIKSLTIAMTRRMSL